MYRSLSKLTPKNIECTTLSRNSSLLTSYSKTVEHIQADITNLEMLKKALNGRVFNYVINLAGCVDHSPMFDGGIEVINSQ